MDNPLAAQARAMVAAGLSVIPISADGSKAPDWKSLPQEADGDRFKHVWKPFQDRLADEAEIEKWFGNGTPRGIAVVGGAVSGNLLILDFDRKLDQVPSWDAYKTACDDHGLLDVLKRCPVIKTPGGGYHVYLRCPDKPKTQKLATRLMPLPDGADIIAKGGRRYWSDGKDQWPVVIKDNVDCAQWGSIETKADGGYVLAPGSPGSCHPSGKVYKQLHGDILQIPLLSAEEVRGLLAMAELLDETSPEAPSARQPSAPTAYTTGLSPGDDYNARGDYERVLEDMGAVRLRSSGTVTSWRRPGKSEGSLSGTTGFGGSRMFFTWSPNWAPFDPGRKYDPFGVYARVRHGGDTSAAARALAAEGYGDPLTPRSIAVYQGVEHRLAHDAGATDELSVAPAYSKHGEIVGLPIIECAGRQLRHMSADALQALVLGNDPPTVFVNQCKLARLIKDDTGKLRPDTLGVDSLTNMIKHRANWVKNELKDVPPPQVIIRDVLASSEWPGVPLLRSIVTTPCLSPQFTMIDTPGYDVATGIYYDALSEIPLVKPSVESIDAAMRLVFDEVLVDFPFKDQASKANAVALMLLPILRPAINGPTPMTIVDAPAAGTGKSLLVELALLLYSPGGVPSRTCPPQDDDAEWKKSITSAILAKSQFFYLDNVAGVIRNTSLLSAITSTSWTDRILGSKDQVDMRHEMIFVATSNNIVMNDELSRRTIWVRLDANMERPDGRTGFKHADIRAYVTVNRAAIIGALLTLVRAWLDGGMKPPDTAVQPLGSFESYTRIMSGVMDYICPGFLGNREQQQAKSTEAGPWHAFVAEWWNEHRTRPVGTGDLLSIAQRHLSEQIGEKGELSQKNRLSKILTRNCDRVFDGRKIVETETGDGVFNVKTFKLRDQSEIRLDI